MIEIWWIGATKEKYIQEGVEEYMSRLKHYTKIKIRVFSDNHKVRDKESVKRTETSAILKAISKEDFLVLLDERGKTLTSIEFAKKLEQWTNVSTRNIIFLVGGSFGVSHQLRDEAHWVLSMSSFTFSHQMIRLFLLEQLYRAFTILRNENYHNE
ncbi:MAG TPA: 23S rRNA (pseudouridine(1915)-N(3))-methyltransferase RlmH [Saprospiraceae bacterium]|nr:23S rRNA (pseudouridine(1915)-N(3))-methyltransferase RlmH [Saprospiraceae bacterium]